MLPNFLKFTSSNTKAKFLIASSTLSKSMKRQTDSSVTSRFVDLGPTTAENTHPRRWLITSFNTALLTNSRFQETLNKMARQSDLGGSSGRKQSLSSNSPASRPNSGPKWSKLPTIYECGALKHVYKLRLTKLGMGKPQSILTSVLQAQNAGPL